MDPNSAAGFVRYMQDPDAIPRFSQPAPWPSHPGFTMLNVPYPPFCSQPPAMGMPRGPGTEEPESSSSSRTSKRVRANPEPTDDSRARMYYTQEEDLRLSCAI
uniref:Uncharacterized protein n=1 Tax=Oryza brachyantha TaxID=4533 RepID=J3N6Y6_ORYBR